VAAAITATGGEALAGAADLTDPAACRHVAARAVEAFGSIDILVANAFSGGIGSEIAEADLDEWRRVFEVNVYGSLHIAQAVVPAMRAHGGGSIIFVNSMAMRLIEPRFGGYAASKGALLTAAQTLAKELGADHIRVNSVVPGYIWGPALEGYFATMAQARGCDPAVIYDEIASRTALHHIPTSEEIARTIVFFASDLAAAVTGQSLDVNAGHVFQ
jgi:NAD(P)-dependent dehydrogenase (short-subunit alcohol dehydrogenase family)